MSVETAEKTDNSAATVTAGTVPGTVASLWRSLIRLDRGKLNSPALAFRNAAAVAMPLGAGIALGYPAAGAALATGALNVSYSDGTDPYAHRARRMLVWSTLGGVAAFSGSAFGPHHWISLGLAASWAFVAGLLVSISLRAGDLGLNTLVTVIVFAARGPSTAGGAVDAGLLVLAGGLIQTLTSLLFWPVHRYDPERRAIAESFRDLAAALIAPDEDTLSDPLSKAPSATEQDTIAALGRDRSVEGERLRLLFDQVDRLRLSANLLRRLQSQAAYHCMSQATADSGLDRLVAEVDNLLQSGADLLRGVATSLSNNQVTPALEEASKRATDLTRALRKLTADTELLGTELGAAADAFTGQLRVVAALANRSTYEGAQKFSQMEASQPWRFQVQGWLATLVSNLSFQSAAFRHGVRSAVFVALAEVLSRAINWQRSYWIPMTVAVILKPDFTTTFSRGFLRLGGTLLGLVVATGLYHLVPAAAAPELILVIVFTYVLRRYGPSNYGVFTVAITGLIVFLMAATGIAPAEVVLQRGANTLAGGCLALVAYAVWPTWERRLVSDVMAEMLDATRLYFQAVSRELDEAEQLEHDGAREARQVWRRARSSAEASVERVSSEPRMTAERLALLQSMLASSHAVVHAAMGLEAGLQQGVTAEPRNDGMISTFRAYAHDVEFTLYFLAAAMRGSTHARGSLPVLREDHRRMVEASGVAHPSNDFILSETDRLTVALNTLREQVLRFAG